MKAVNLGKVICRWAARDKQDLAAPRKGTNRLVRA
jgi:hypothetical protein